jgi:Flp pilus assembly protein TadD
MTLSDSARRSFARWFLVGLIPLGALAAYWGSLSAPFIFDDFVSITENPSIKSIFPLSRSLSPPDTGAGVTGRPIVNFSLALNYAWGGFHVQGYHVFNLAIHALAGLTLFGIVRRTLLGPALPPRCNEAAFPLALIIALLWTLHPLQTESVTCIIQRTESLMGLFYLLTLYAFIRSVDFSREDGLSSAQQRLWQTVSVVACLGGMATKEVMVTAPVVLLLYDRTFVSGSFAESWRERLGYYASLTCTWLLLAWLVIHSGGERGGTVTMSGTVTPWNYLLTQCDALVLYIKLALWPHPLVVDYGMAVRTHLVDVWPEGAGIIALLAITGVALWRWPTAGFLGAVFFVVLAPSSSILPLITQTAAEHRMYLPLCPVICAFVVGLFLWVGRAAIVTLPVLIVGFGALTFLRNEAYRTRFSIWEDTVAKLPLNSRAHFNLGKAQLNADRVEDSIVSFQDALRLDPPYNLAHRGLAVALDTLGKSKEALAHARFAVKFAPGDTSSHVTLGLILTHLAQFPEAEREFNVAIHLHPDAMTYYNSANVLALMQRPAEAEANYEQAIKLDPTIAMAHFNLGITLVARHRDAEAIPHFEEALRLQPDMTRARDALAKLREKNASRP